MASHSLSSGNVFADLELPCADGRLFKARLAVLIRRLIEDKGWTQSEAAEAIGLELTHVSHLLRGLLAGFSLGQLLNIQLLNILNRLGHSVEVRVSAEEVGPSEAQTLVTLG
jgi:predicted XRE-type DNA-binding protein